MMTFAKFCNDIFGYRIDKIFDPHEGHYGACTKLSTPCNFCMMEIALTEYRIFIFGNVDLFDVKDLEDLRKEGKDE